MNEKEVSEIRRRFRPDKTNITHIRGCYVNELGEIVSEFDQSLAMMTQEEAETFLAILKRALSGALGRNLIDISFATRQVAEGESHRRLMDLRGSGLRDDGAVRAFFQLAIQTLAMEGNYLILLAHDTYDVPWRSGDGVRQDDAGDGVYSYLLCAVCPVKPTKPALSYYAPQNQFRTRAADWLVAPPELGFLFPAFNNRSTDLYHALYYTRDAAGSRPEFAQAIFAQELPMPAEVQKESFRDILGEALAEECRYEVVQTVHDSLCGMIEDYKADREADEPPAISREDVRRVLRSCGVPEEHADRFEEAYGQVFGEDAGLSPGNLVDPKQLEVRTPDVTIRVSPACGDRLETRVIDGRKYILIRADGGVEVNGVPIHIG